MPACPGSARGHERFPFVRNIDASMQAGQQRRNVIQASTMRHSSPGFYFLQPRTCEALDQASAGFLVQSLGVTLLADLNGHLQRASDKYTF
eukprot:scaffold173576_cov14-Tisochrysis_lutea.AAC.2